MNGLILATSAAAIVVSASQALAQDEPSAEIEAGSVTFTFEGQINQAMLFYDDGVESTTYGPVDNDNSSSRITLDAESDAFEGLTLGGTFELEFQPYASDAVSLENRGDPDFDFQDDDLRKLEVFVESDRFGTLSLGQGDMASNESAEADLSGTTVVANSDVEDTAGGQLLRTADGGVSDVAIDDVFDNLDGLSRLVRVRYDTPGLAGDRLTFSASYGQDRLANNDDTDQYDVAAAFENEGETFTVAAAAAYAWEGEDTTILSGSASVLHEPTGLSATVAAGRQDDGEVEGGYGYVKLGYEADLLAIGPTAVSIDAFRSTDLPAEGGSGRSYALAVVQTVERFDAELYAAVRAHEYDDDEADYEDGTAILIGARFSF